MPTPEDDHLVGLGPRQWVNFHGTVHVPIQEQWRITNSSSASTMAGMRETAERLQRLIAFAVGEGVRMRPMGSRWSFSEIGVAENGWALQTDRLNFDFTVGPGSLDPGFTGDAAGLVFVQTGASVAEINRKIEAAPRLRSLATSGASNGQTIGGALGTGVHGSAIDHAGMEGEVLGLQLLTAERNMWIEDPAHGAAAQRGIAVENRRNRAAGDGAHDEPAAGAGVAEIEGNCGLGETGHPNAPDRPGKWAGPLDLGAQRLHRFGRIEHVFTLEKARNPGFSDRKRPQDQGTVRNRLVAGDADLAGQGAAGAGFQGGRGA